MTNTQEKDNDMQTLIAEAKRLKVWGEVYDQLLKMNQREILRSLLRGKLEDNRQKQELKRQLARDEVIRAHNLQGTYTNGVAFQFPPILHNSQVEPSLEGKRTTTVVGDDGEKKNVQCTIPGAKIKRIPSNAWLEPTEIKVPYLDANGCYLPSTLGSAFCTKNGKFSYANEFDVQKLVMHVVDDAIYSLGLMEDVRAHSEIAFYTLKPDIVVVLRHEGRLIFAIEVKSPGNKDEVFKSEIAGGQIWSYLNVMKQLGNERPMGAIMTYDKMVLVTLEDYSSEAEHQALLTMTRRNLGTTQQPQRQEQNLTEEKFVDRRESPVRVQKSISKSMQSQACATGDFEEVTVERDVFYSKIYEGGDVFPCLLQALEIAYQSCNKMEILKELPVVHPNDDLGRRLFFKVDEAGYSFVITPLKYRSRDGEHMFHANLGDLPATNTTHFYMLGKAGEGHEGAVYISCNSSARLCAIKVYHVTKSSAATPEARETDEKREIDDIWENKAKIECERWNKIHKTRFRGVRQLYLGGTPCLLLPYGLEIDNNKERRRQLPSIKNELKRIANEFNLRYRGSDVRWRHVLLDSKGQIFLSDLGSLEEIGKDEDIAQVVEEQVGVLKRVLVDENFAILTPRKRDASEALENQKDDAARTSSPLTSRSG